MKSVREMIFYCKPLSAASYVLVPQAAYHSLTPRQKEAIRRFDPICFRRVSINKTIYYVFWLSEAQLDGIKKIR
jgi:hypothetical protein